MHGEEFGVFVSGGVEEHSEVAINLDDNSLPFHRPSWTWKKVWNKLYQCFSTESRPRWTWSLCTARPLLDGSHFQPHSPQCYGSCSYYGRILLFVLVGCGAALRGFPELVARGNCLCRKCSGWIPIGHSVGLCG